MTISETVSLHEITLRERSEGRAEQDRYASPRRFALWAFDDVNLGDAPPWLVKDILPVSGLAVIVGEPGCGKSFMCTDLGLCIATARRWGGKDTTPGTVVYITPEGVSGFRKRLVAYRQHHKLKSNIQFYFIIDAPNLGQFPGDVDAICDRINDLEAGPRIIFIDTLARSMGGADENSTADMGVLVENCDRLAKTYNCLVVLVHHLGKDTNRGARGSSVLKAAADVEITVIGSEGERTAKITKSKDGEAGIELTFILDRVELGEDLSSCVLHTTNDWSFPVAHSKSSPRRKGSLLKRGSLSTPCGKRSTSPERSPRTTITSQLTPVL